MEEENKTIETVTKSYEEKIIEIQKQHDLEIKQVKEQMEKEKEDAIKSAEEKHNKELSDYILGRKQIEELKKDKKNDEEKSFFENAVEKTKERLKKGE